MDAVLDDRPGFGIQEGRPILQLAGTREENWWRRRESNPATSVVLAPYRGGIAQKCPICRNRSAAGASYLARRTTIPLAAWTNGTMALPCGAGDQANLLDPVDPGTPYAPLGANPVRRIRIRDSGTPYAIDHAKSAEP